MKCSICKRNDAIIHVHEYSEKGVRKINLCLKCAIKKGLNTSIEELDGIFSNFIKNLFKENKSRNKLKSSDINYKVNLTCPECKTTINEFSDDLMLGCSVCYTVFEQIIDLIIYKRNNSLNYKGKLPKILNIVKEDKTNLFMLKDQLNNYIMKEDYKKAAEIRDEIKKLKRKINRRMKEIAGK